jgi:hypothetical protein
MPISVLNVLKSDTTFKTNIFKCFVALHSSATKLKDIVQRNLRWVKIGIKQ